MIIVCAIIAVGVSNARQFKWISLLDVSSSIGWLISFIIYLPIINSTCWKSDNYFSVLFFLSFRSSLCVILCGVCFVFALDEF